MYVRRVYLNRGMGSRAPTLTPRSGDTVRDLGKGTNP